MSRQTHYTLHVLSDATGGLARHMITAIVSQFPSVQFQEVYHPFVTSVKRIEEVAKELRPRRQIVLHALVDPECKEAVRKMCARQKVPHFDLTGSLVQFIADHTGTAPADDLSRLHPVDAGYFHRIDAMEFTAQHDDSRRLESIHEADLVLIGLSRVSKSPTSTYLGAQGLKVANVSVSPQTGFPRELGKVGKRKVVALTLQPKALQQIRHRRMEKFDDAARPYMDLRTVIQEVMWAEGEYRKRGYHILDVTGMTIEQAAAAILSLTKVAPPKQQYA